MTASELYEIVKDCPEAWPPFCEYWTNQFDASSFHYGPHTYTDECAVLMFEASGMRWLLSHVGYVGESQRDDDLFIIWRDAVEARSQPPFFKVEESSPVAAIFAAIKAVKGTP